MTFLFLSNYIITNSMIIRFLQVQPLNHYDLSRLLLIQFNTIFIFFQVIIKNVASLVNFVKKIIG